MIFLLTGQPFAGKSTAAQEFVKRFTGPCQWVITREVTDANAVRVGYEAVNSARGHHLLAHQTAIQSEIVIGHLRYHVDASAIDEMFTEPLRDALKRPSDCFVLDEIGNMQRLSPAFTEAVDIAFDHDITMLATIRTNNDWTATYLNHPNAYPLAVTPATRDQLPELLTHIFSGLPLLSALAPAQVGLVRDLTHAYCKHDSLVQLDKLYYNALRYVADRRVERSGQATFTVGGNHGRHEVILAPEPHCDCPLFTGTGVYTGQAGECSHLMAARILQAA